MAYEHRIISYNLFGNLTWMCVVYIGIWNLSDTIMLEHMKKVDGTIKISR